MIRFGILTLNQFNTPLRLSQIKQETSIFYKSEDSTLNHVPLSSMNQMHSSNSTHTSYQTLFWTLLHDTIVNIFLSSILFWFIPI